MPWHTLLENQNYNARVGQSRIIRFTHVTATLPREPLCLTRTNGIPRRCKKLILLCGTVYQGKKILFSDRINIWVTIFNLIV